MSRPMPRRISAALRFAALALALSGCAAHRARGAKPSLLFLTDFGTRDGAVAACKGVMSGIAPRLRVTDLSHDVPPFDIETAGEVLEQAVPFFPPGTVVVAVVDPGVGGARKPMAARTRAGHLLVGPDNGLFTRLLDLEGLDEAVALAETRYWRGGDASSTFHGRDIFAPVGAHLAAGVALNALGPPLAPVRLESPAPKREGDRLIGRVRYIEHPFGNVVTDIPIAMLEDLGIRPGVDILVDLAGKEHRFPYKQTFSDVPAGEPLALPHSRGTLSFSINQGDFAAAFGLKRGGVVSVMAIK